MLSRVRGPALGALFMTALVACSAAVQSPSSSAVSQQTVTVTSTVRTTASLPTPTTEPPTVSTTGPAQTTSAGTAGTTSPTSPSTSEPTSTSEQPATSEQPGAPERGFAITEADRAQAAEIVSSLSRADKAASVLMVTGSQAIGTSLLKDRPFGGVILFAPGGVVDGTASGTPSQVKAVTTALRKAAANDPTRLPPLIATDQEYGLVQRLKNGFTSFPDAEAIGSIPNEAKAAKLARKAAKAAAREMRAVGVTVNFAPVFGVTPADGSASSIGQYGRSYGSDPERVATLVSAVVAGYQSGGIVAVLKHFPGLARIAADSHVTLPTLPVSCKNWNAHEAIPAQAGVDAGAAMMMTGHVLFPAVDGSRLPTSISPTIVDMLLRGDGVNGCQGMNFTGVTVTDSMQMQPITAHYSAAAAAVAALNAGEDLVLMSSDPVAAVKGIVVAVKDGTLPESRLDEAATAVLAVRIASERVSTPKLGIVGSAKNQALAQKIRAAAR